MSITDVSFFRDNIVSVNKMVEKVMFFSIFVPIAFIVLTHLGIWFVPNLYSVCLISFSFISTAILHFLNKREIHQKFSMYLGVVCAILFVDYLGFNSVIVITISYGFATFISCLYYDRKLTIVTTIVTYITLIFVIYCRSLTIHENYEFVKAEQSNMEWFISNMSGITVEFVFVFIIGYFMSTRTHRTLKELVNVNEERDNALKNLKERNQYIIKLNNELERKNKELELTQFKIIVFVAKCLGSHDLFTGRHVIHTQKYVEVICHELRDEGYYVDELNDRSIELFSQAAFLHDIGKIHIPEGILNKIGMFTPEEYALMKCHPGEGKKLLEFLPPIEGGRFNDIAKKMAYFHHEKWDGTGYPNGVSHYDIPLCARIMAAADVLDALISQRLYREPLSIDEAMDIFSKSRGLHFEPCIADAVINCRSLIETIDKDFKIAEAESNAEELEWWQRYHSRFDS